MRLPAGRQGIRNAGFNIIRNKEQVQNLQIRYQVLLLISLIKSDHPGYPLQGSPLGSFHQGGTFKNVNLTTG